MAFNRLDGQPDRGSIGCWMPSKRAQGVKVEIPADIVAALWAKLPLSPHSAGSALSRASQPEVLRCVPRPAPMLKPIGEVVAVARAFGVHLPADRCESVATIDGLPAGGTASMQRDIMEGRPSELEAQTGSVVRMGKAAGVPTPVNQFLYAALLPQEKKARGE